MPIASGPTIIQVQAMISGSVVGLLVGGVPVSSGNPVPVTGALSITGPITGTVSLSGPITGTVGISGPITGTVGISGPVAVSNFPSVQNVTGSAWTPTVTGSVVVANRVDVTGSVGLTGPVAVSNFPATQNVTGSAWTPTITGSVVVANRVDVTGSVGITAPVAVSNFPTTQNVTGSAWTPTVTGSVVVANRVDVTGSVGITAPVAISNFPANQSVTQGTTPWVVSGSAWTPTITGSVTVQNRVDVTGSVGLTGPITGSVVLASAPTVLQGTNPWIISGSAWTPTITGSVTVQNQVNITGTVGIAASVAINNFPASQTVAGTVTANQGTANATPWAVTGSVQIVSGGLGAQVLNSAPGADTGQPALAVRIISSVGGGSAVTTTSGSVTGLLLGGVAVAGNNPLPITGSVTLAAAPQIASGSVTGLLVGGVAVSNANPVPVTGSVTLAAAPQIASGSVTGLLYGGVAASAANPIFINQVSGSVTGLLVGGVAVSNANPVPVTGSVTLAAAPQIASGSVTGLLVGGVAVSNANPLPTQDARPVTGSITNTTASLTPQQVLASNTNRRGVTMFNDAPTGIALVNFGLTANSSLYGVQIAPKALFELPYPIYTGPVAVLWIVAASGTMRTTEFS